MKLFTKVPWALLLAILWIIAKTSGLSTSLSSPWGVALLIASFLVFTTEFYKSGDITLGAFGTDLFCSVLQLIAVTAATTSLIIQSGWAIVTLADGLFALVILSDAWFSPYNSFKTGLRNFAAQTEPS